MLRIPSKSDLILIEQERARRGLLNFIKDGWNVLEPREQPFVEGWAVAAICEHLEAVTSGQIKRLIITVPPGFMKLCADSTPVLTPDGYRTHGELKIGDSVFGPDGSPRKIVNISADGIADYEVTFSTHETIKCNSDHLWHVYDRFAKKWVVVDTAFLYSAKREKNRNRFFVQDTACLQFPERNLPIHPYFLGCWLGDGNNNKPVICHSKYDTQHIQKIINLGYTLSKQWHQNETVFSSFTRQSIVNHLRSLNIYKNKRIPEAYLLSSESQRLELLAGLVDTDGTVDKVRQRCIIGTCCEYLADDIKKLILSLGMRPYITKTPALGYGKYTSDKTYYMIGFNPTSIIPTALPRKKIERTNFSRRRRAITSIKKSETPEVGHCITVDHPDGLYIVGNTNIPTHNSLTTCVYWEAWEWGPKNKPHTKYLLFSYAADLSTRDNRKCRLLIESDWYKERWGENFAFSSDQNQKQRYENT